MTKVRTISTPEDLGKLTRLLERSDRICVDIETQTDEGLDNRQEWHPSSRIVCASFTHKPGVGYVVPLTHPVSPWKLEWRAIMRKLLQAAMADEGKLIAHNAPYEGRWCDATCACRITRHIWWDTMMSAHLLDENRPKDLKSLGVEDLGVDPWGIDLANPEKEDWDKLSIYNAKDTDYCFQIHEIHKEELKQDEAIARVWKYIGMPITRAFNDIHRTGILLDTERVKEGIRESEEEAAQAEAELAEWIPEELREEFGDDTEHEHDDACDAWKCPSCGVRWSVEDGILEDQDPPWCWLCEKQARPFTCRRKIDKRYPISWSPTSKFFSAFMHANAEVIEVTKNGSPCWDAAVLKKLAQRGYEFTAPLLRHRDHTKRLTFYHDWLARVSSLDRLHTSYKPAHVVTGRISSETPNMQQVSKRQRPCFIAPEGWWFVDVDQSQIELRIAAELSWRVVKRKGMRARMMEAYKEGRDLHLELATRINSDEATRTTQMLLMSTGLPTDRTGTEVLQSLFKEAPKGTESKKLLQLCCEIGENPKARNREWWESGGGVESLLERRNISPLLSTSSEGFMRALRKYGKLVRSSQGRSQKQQSPIQLADSMSLLSQIGTSAIIERFPIWEELRSKAKPVSFGFLYGMLAPTFVDQAWRDYQLDFTLDEAQELRQIFFATWPEIEVWHEYQRNYVRQYGYVRNLIGRKRRLPDIYSSSDYNQGEAERKAINAPVQSLASDLMMLGMAECHRRLDSRAARIVGTVHDSIMFEIRKDCLKPSLQAISKALFSLNLRKRFGVELTVPLEIEYSIGYFWGDPEAKEVTVKGDKYPRT